MSDAVTHEDMQLLRKEIKRLKPKDVADNRWVVPSLITAAVALLVFLLSQNTSIVKDLGELRVDVSRDLGELRVDVAKQFNESDSRMDSRFSLMENRFNAAALENEKRFNELDRKLDSLQVGIDGLRQRK